CYIRACDAGDNCGEAFKNVTIGNSKPSLYEPANDSNTLLLVHFDEEHFYGMEGELGKTDVATSIFTGKVYYCIDGSAFSYLYYNGTDNFNYAAGTVEMWVQPQWDATDKAENVFFDTTASESWWSWFFTSRVRLMKDRNGGLECRMYPYYSKSVVARTGIRDWKSGEWHHIACTWDDSANTIKLYVDGELEKTTNWKYSLSFNPSYLHIGTDFNNQTKANAYIDEFRISDIARTSFPHAKALLTPANRTQLEVNATDIDWSNGTDRDGDTVKYKLAIYLESEITAQKLNISYLNESDWGWDQETGVIESVNDGDDTLTDLDKNWETNQLSYIAKKTDKINITLQAGGTVVSNVSSNNATTITLDATDLSSVQAGDTYQISYTHLDDAVYYWLAQPHDGTEYGDRSDERIYFVIDAQPPSVHNSTYDPDPVYNNNDVNFSAIITGGPIDTVWYGYGQTCSLMTNYTGGISSSGDQYQILVHNSNFSNQGGFCFQWHANDIGAKYQAGELMPFTVQNRAPSVPNITGPTNATVFSDNGADTRNVIFNWTNSSDADMGNGCTGISCNGFTYLLYLSDYEFNVSSLENVTIQYNGTVNTTNIAVTSGTWYWLVSVDDYIDTNETNVSQFTFNTAPNTSWIKTYTTTYIETKIFPTENTVVIRVNVSDSNNYTDISAVVINITDSNNVKKVINAQMTAVENLSLGRLYEYNLTLLTDWPSGEWTINITANDTLDQKGSNSTTFNVTYPDYRFDVRLYLNATTHIVYVPGTGELNASDLGGETNYSSPTHYYIASHLNNVVSGLVNYEGTFRKFYTENTTINHMIGLSQDFTNSKVFLAFTNGDWKRFEQQTTNLERKTFLNFVSPSFAYGLGLYLPIKILLEYSDIDIQGDQIIRKGYHEITLESNATGTQKALAIKRT
ncbi:MAG: LamG domain-containing protein, partial [Nanoarchaeota archaeon]